jgi:hypothetical protein
MTAAALITDLARHEISLSVNGEKLRVEGPAELLTAELRALLAPRKPELMAVLTGDWCGAAAAVFGTICDVEIRGDVQHRFDERAGICEYDGGVSRADAERMAFEEVSRELQRL